MEEVLEQLMNGNDEEFDVGLLDSIITAAYDPQSDQV